jgi:Leucine-rich repeat (LRR) protein
MEDISSIIRRCKRASEPKLSLAGKGLMSIPQDVFGLTFLQHLDLSGNKLTQIDPKIAQLTSLKVLNLSNNSLLDLPSELTKLPNLEQLLVTNNPLSKQFDALDQSNVRTSLLRCFNLSESESPLLI